LATKIRAIRPEWFVKTADTKRSILLELARSGAKRPSSISKDPEESGLGRALISYTSLSARSKSYNREFDVQIRSINPGWFENTIGIQHGQRFLVSSSVNKSKLLELARSGANKPSRSSKDPEEHRLSALLYSYVSGYCKQYDAAFDKELSALRPDWFPTGYKKGPYAAKKHTS
jgi:hypothetical protein